MRNTLAALSLAAGIGLVCGQSAFALPINANAIQQNASDSAGVIHAQYAESNHRGRTTKCYREFVIGSYSCHSYRNW
jgi:hypothetical protein